MVDESLTLRSEGCHGIAAPAGGHGVDLVVDGVDLLLQFRNLLLHFGARIEEAVHILLALHVDVGLHVRICEARGRFGIAAAHPDADHVGVLDGRTACIRQVSDYTEVLPYTVLDRGALEHADFGLDEPGGVGGTCALGLEHAVARQGANEQLGLGLVDRGLGRHHDEGGGEGGHDAGEHQPSPTDNHLPVVTESHLSVIVK